MSQILIAAAWDAGVTDGDPGEGRVRVNASMPRQASHILISGHDRHGARIGEYVSDWKSGDVVVIERAGNSPSDEPAARIVAWVMGDVVNAGAYLKVPVSVRSVDGAFAAHDLIALHRAEEAEVAAPARIESPPIPTISLMGQPIVLQAAAAPPMTPMTPMPSESPAPQPTGNALPSPPPPVNPTDMAALLALLERHGAVIEQLVADVAWLKANAVVGIDTNLETVMRQLLEARMLTIHDQRQPH